MILPCRKGCSMSAWTNIPACFFTEKKKYALFIAVTGRHRINRAKLKDTENDE